MRRWRRINSRRCRKRLGSVLLRRVYVDLIGLPPTREELQVFLSDITGCV
jgi:hypothetical protein